MKIKVKSREVYGNELFYPVCETAQAFANLTNKKTLSPYSLRIIKNLKYSIVNQYDYDITEIF